MDRHYRSSGFRPRLLAAIFVALLIPALGRAGSLQLQNDAPFSVVIQGASVVRGLLVRDRPYLLSTGDKSPAVLLTGNKVITIYEAKVPNRLLFQGVIPVATEDQVFKIQFDSGRIKLEKQRPKNTDQP
jgi:hypothetical protein